MLLECIFVPLIGETGLVITCILTFPFLWLPNGYKQDIVALLRKPYFASEALVEQFQGTPGRYHLGDGPP